MAQISSISQVEKYEKERAAKAAAKAIKATNEEPKAEAKAEPETKEGGKK